MEGVLEADSSSEPEELRVSSSSSDCSLSGRGGDKYSQASATACRLGESRATVQATLVGPRRDSVHTVSAAEADCVSAGHPLTWIPWVQPDRALLSTHMLSIFSFVNTSSGGWGTAPSPASQHKAADAAAVRGSALELCSLVVSQTPGMPSGIASQS